LNLFFCFLDNALRRDGQVVATGASGGNQQQGQRGQGQHSDRSHRAPPSRGRFLCGPVSETWLTRWGRKDLPPPAIIRLTTPTRKRSWPGTARRIRLPCPVLPMQTKGSRPRSASAPARGRRTAD